MNDVWNGRWVCDRLGIGLVTDARKSLVDLTNLVGLALRRNHRRAHLLVSAVLGKHVPTDPVIVHGAGRLLGAITADAVASRCSGVAETGGALLKGALTGRRTDAQSLAALCHAHAERPPADWTATAAVTTVLGFAETATGLGHTVAEALNADYLHSTRRRPLGAEELSRFEEEHSHAAAHLLFPEDPGLLDRPGPLVLVDDELSTGRTALNTISALHARTPRSRYVIATLVDLRSPTDHARMAEAGRILGVDIDVVSLAAGRVNLPDDILEVGRRLVAAHGAVASPVKPGGNPTRTIPVSDWNGIREGGRHGFSSSDRDALDRAAGDLATRLIPSVTGDRVLVLGFEEMMYAPLLIARELTSQFGDDATVRFAATTRSPVLAIDDPAYAIRTGLTFPSHDNPADGPGPRFAYNIAPGTDPVRRFTDVIFVADDESVTTALHGQGGLLDQLAGWCDQVHLLALPTYRPTPIVGGVR